MDEHTQLIYRRLAGHLDRLPDGFPPAENDADLRLLERLFSVEEASLAVHLTLERESAAVIAARAGLTAEQVGPRLEEMAKKGLILAHRAEDGSPRYQASPLVVGIYEFQVQNLDLDLLGYFVSYWSSVLPRPQVETIPQLRVIPVGESIRHHLEALPYEQVYELVRSSQRFAVAPCICRRAVKLAGGGCDAPEESCLVFGDWADFYVRSGRARPIAREEVLEILARADASNLVLQPSNAREIEFICCCCGCCCGVLGDLKRHPRPADYAASAYIARLDAALCGGCGTCLERCQMEALAQGAGGVELQEERCIGCGLCVTTCPNGALTLVRKPQSALTQPPATLDETWRIIAGGQAAARPQ